MTFEPNERYQGPANIRGVTFGSEGNPDPEVAAGTAIPTDDPNRGRVPVTCLGIENGGNEVSLRAGPPNDPVAVSVEVVCVPCDPPPVPTAIELIADATLDNIIQSTLDDLDASQCSTLPNSDTASDIDEFSVADDLQPADMQAILAASLSTGGIVTDFAPCDAEHVVCGGPDDAIDNSTRLVYGVVSKVGEVPMGEGGCRFESLVLETDGDTANDWVPQGNFGCDYYQGTDTWLQLDKDAGDQWSASLQQVSGNQVAGPSDLAYRIIRDGDTTHFIIDGSSFASPRVSGRLVTFNDPSCSFDFAQLHGDVSGDSPQAPPTLAVTP